MDSSIIHDVNRFERMDDIQLAAGLTGALKDKRSANLRRLGPSFILMISWGVCLFICAFFYEGPSKTPLVAVLSFVAIVGLVSIIISFYRFLLCELSISAVRDFMWIRSDNGCVRYSDRTGVSIPHEVLAELKHVSKQCLIAKLGMGCQYKGLKLYTTMFYLGIDPNDKSHTVVTLSKCLEEERLYIQVVSLTDFIRHAFEGKEIPIDNIGIPPYRLIGRICRANSDVKRRLIDSIQADMLSELKDVVREGSAFLREFLKRRPFEIEQLNEYNDLQLKIWCEDNLPTPSIRYWLSRNRSPARLLFRLIKEDKMDYREVPSELLRLGAEYCLAYGNDEDLSEFCRWMWKSTPAPAPMPENPAAENGWMLAVAGNYELYRQFRPLYAKSPRHFEAFQEIAKKIIERVGLQAKNPPGDAFIFGHRALYGQEETLARFPSSGKVLLAKDLDL